MSEVHLTDESFQSEVKDYKGVVLVDFWAPWCGPCRMLGPIIEDVAKDMGEKVKVGKVNVDEEGSLAQEFQIMSIPAVYIFKDGQVVESMIGLQPKESYIDALNKHLG
ncbi:MAG: thioredoxin [Candidatus Dojkabacteria bacterium]|nr:thioredoxin [Candidatus Dojkabacteria bacterium]